MVIVMSKNAGEDEIQQVIARLIEMNFDVHRSTGVNHTVLGAIGDKGGSDPETLANMPGVQKVVPISEPYKLVSRTFQPEDTVIEINGVRIGGQEVVAIAGPCSVESEEQMERIAAFVRQAGARLMRGGAFKPRTSPYAFQGLGEEGLRILRETTLRHGLLAVSEVMDPAKAEMTAGYVDILQVGARNMQNYDLLRQLAKLRTPVLLKRGLSATIEETLMAAEYLMSGGNYQVILCERGIRTFERMTRNTLDISAVPLIQSLSHLPVIVDPSHGTGRRDQVVPMARAAVAAGADGVMIEVHHDPDNALSDGAQSLFLQQFEDLMHECSMIANAIGRTMAYPRGQKSFSLVL